jgi:hypothetical protein
MMRRIGVLLIGILGLALILPWGAYWVGLIDIEFRSTLCLHLRLYRHRSVSGYGASPKSQASR